MNSLALSKKSYMGEGGKRVRGENKREELAYVFDLRFDLDV
jgi:hypothetical protein